MWQKNLRSPQSEVTDSSRQEEERTRVMSAEPRRYKNQWACQAGARARYGFAAGGSSLHLPLAERSQKPADMEPRKCSLSVETGAGQGRDKTNWSGLAQRNRHRK